jgi:hypothetical protein
MLETLIPFHQQAEDIGTFLLTDRARDAELRRGDQQADGPSENTD